MNFIEGIHEACKSSYPKATFIITFIGFIIILRKIFRMLGCAYGLVRPRKNLPKRYGRKSWAFITGSSDGTSITIVRYWKSPCCFISKVLIQHCVERENKRKTRKSQ